MGLAFKAFCLAMGEASIASPERVASQGKVTIFVFPLKASLALQRRSLPLSKAKIASLLAPSGALSLASR